MYVALLHAFDVQSIYNLRHIFVHKRYHYGHSFAVMQGALVGHLHDSDHQWYTSYC
jgi:hypothetical protein